MSKKNYKLNRRRSGFTLVENLMTLTIVGTVGGIATTAYIDFKDDANQVATLRHMFDLKLAVRGNSNAQNSAAFFSDMGRYPNSLNELAARGTQGNFNPFIKRGWRGPYVNSSEEAWDKDSWGNSLQYDPTTYVLKSCGADQICGGANATDDITLVLNN